MTTVTVSPRVEERPKEGSYVPRTQLSRRLVELRNRGIRAGTELLSIPDIIEEVTRRQG
jgi:hypothetical protein